MTVPLYLFLDEGGNFDFSTNGSRYFSLSCVSTVRPFALHPALDAYKYDCIEFGLSTEYFHCAEDNTHVRRRVFEIISRHLDTLRIDSLLVEKSKITPLFQEPKKFYPEMLGCLLRRVINEHDLALHGEIIVVTDTLPQNKKRDAVEKAIKQTLSEMLCASTRYRIYHHASKAHYGLQIADYCNWAVLRKWERSDNIHYQRIQAAIKNMLEVCDFEVLEEDQDGISHLTYILKSTVT